MPNIYFNRVINQQKPSTLKNEKEQCPFCDHRKLADTISQKDDMLVVRNKYNTLEDSDMFVLIETAKCGCELEDYSISKTLNLLEYAISLRQKLVSTNKYRSVALFKNKGLMSSGTISHSHMQLIGFKNINCMEDVTCDHVQGVEISIENMSKFNLSTNPLISFLEFNIKISNDLLAVSKAVNLIVNYIDKTYWGNKSSYNIFFYQINDDIYLKIIPRYPTSSIKLGYNITQRYDVNELNIIKDHILQFASGHNN